MQIHMRLWIMSEFNRLSGNRLKSEMRLGQLDQHGIRRSRYLVTQRRLSNKGMKIPELILTTSVVTVDFRRKSKVYNIFFVPAPL